MRIIKLLLTTIISVALFAGCLKVNTKLKINKDGSGTIEEKVLMSDAVVIMMKEFMSSFQDSSSTPEEFKLFKEDELIDKAMGYGEGVEYVRGEEIKVDGWEGYKAIYSFEDINLIQIATDPNDKIESGELGEREYFLFKFTRGSTSELIINRPDISPSDMEIEAEEESGNNQLDDKFIKMLDGMMMKVSVEFEGKIIETNAEYADKNNITLLDIDFGKILKNKDGLKKLKNNPPKNLDDMKAIIENIPGIKMDLQNPIRVKF